MAGDWIKMKVDLASNPKVIAIAAVTGLEEDTVVGKLHRLWSWADQHTADGNAPGVTRKWLNAHMRVDGFAEALEKVDWLKVTKRGISLPRFDEHNGKTGKQRALTSKRVAKNRNAASVTTALAREDKREDKREEEDPPKPPRGKSGSLAGTRNYSQGFENFWAAFPRERRTDKPKAWVSYQSAVEALAQRFDNDTGGAEAFLATRAAEYALSPRGRSKYVRGPRPWLNGQCWDDAPEAWARGDDPPERNGEAKNYTPIFLPEDEP